MRVAQYVAQERAIAAADRGGIRQRWMFGLRLLRDPGMTNPRTGRLRHGATATLIEANRKRGVELSEREIQRRIQCARTYQTEGQFRHAVAEFETWRDLAEARFPAFPRDPEEAPADHRNDTERDHDNARALLDLVGEQGALFPLSMFEPAEATLKELFEYADQQDELTERFAARGRKRRAYLEQLRDAVGDDLSVTWQQAHKSAFGDEPGGAS